MKMNVGRHLVYMMEVATTAILFIYYHRINEDRELIFLGKWFLK